MYAARILSKEPFPPAIGSADTAVLEICALEYLVSHDFLLLSCDIFIHVGLTVLNQLIDSCLLFVALNSRGAHPS